MSQGLKILNIDDEKINLLLFQRLMGKKYSIIPAESGQKALDILDKDPEIKHVITDLSMPRMSGFEFILKAREKYSDKIYYLLTGFAINDTIQKALDKGIIRRYFTKPTNFDEIDEAIQQNVDGKQWT